MLSCKVTNSMPLFGRSFGTCRKNKTYLGARHCKGHAEPWTMAINVYSIAKLRSILLVLILRWQALCGKFWQLRVFGMEWCLHACGSIQSTMTQDVYSFHGFSFVYGNRITWYHTRHYVPYSIGTWSELFYLPPFFLHQLWFRFCCPTLAQVVVGQLSTKGSRVASSHASFHRGLVDDGGIGGRPAMGRKGWTCFWETTNEIDEITANQVFRLPPDKAKRMLFAYDFEYLIVWNGEILWNVRTLQVSEVSIS